MAGERDQEKLTQGPPAAVPTAFGTEITLPPGGTAAVNFQVLEQDLILSGISATAEGPAVLRIQFTDAPDPGAPTVQLPGGTFEEYLERELPTHLGAQVGEDIKTWAEKNQTLFQAAYSGDDNAFFELLARDPRQLTSELTLRRVLTWRTEIDQYNQVYRIKASRLLIPGDTAEEARRRMELARKNLVRLGESQLRVSDQRGKRPLPPAGPVRGVYYGLLCLLSGLRSIWLEREKAGVPHKQIERNLSGLIAALEGLRGECPLLPYIGLATKLVRDPEVLAHVAGTDGTFATLVGLRGTTPSDMARAVTAACFEVSEDTVERLCAQSAPIPLPPAENELRYLLGRPTYDLLELPEVKDLITTLTR